MVSISSNVLSKASTISSTSSFVIKTVLGKMSLLSETKNSPSASSESGSVKAGYVVETTVNEIAELNDGYKHELRKNFGFFSLLGVGFGLTNSWFGISASLVSGINVGGPMVIVYGIIIVSAITFCEAISLGELTSCFPENSGGQYYWTFQLAPKKYRRFLAYLTGSFNWFGAIFTSASITISIATAVVGMYVLSSGRSEGPKTWEVFVAYEVINLFMVIFNIYERPLPLISQLALWISVGSFVVITIVVLACTSGKYQTAEFVFVDFDNGTGWNSGGIAFILGLINPTWSFNGLDSATHMCEEMFDPETKIPISLIANVAIGFSTSFIYAVCMFFCIQDLDALLNSITGVPIMDIFYQSLGNKHGALFLEALIVITAFGCNITCQTWGARLCWSFARDEGIPGSRWWKVVNKRTGLPVNAHLFTCFWCAVVGCIYMGSTTAYNAFVAAPLFFLIVTYAIPILCALYIGRNNIKHGPFWMGSFGYFCNIVVVLWGIFIIVFFSFPSVMPVTAQNMNYVSVVFVGLTVYSVIYWHVRAKKIFARDHIPKAELIEEILSIQEEAEIDSSTNLEEKITKTVV